MSPSPLRTVDPNEPKSYGLSLALPASVLSCGTSDFLLLSFFFDGVLPSAASSASALSSKQLRGRCFFLSFFCPCAQDCSSLSPFLFLFPPPGLSPGSAPPDGPPSPPSGCASCCFFSCRAFACWRSRSNRTRARAFASASSSSSSPCFSSSPPYLQQPRTKPPQAQAARSHRAHPARHPHSSPCRWGTPGLGRQRLRQELPVDAEKRHGRAGPRRRGARR